MSDKILLSAAEIEALAEKDPIFAAILRSRIREVSDWYDSLPRWAKTEKSVRPRTGPYEPAPTPRVVLMPPNRSTKR